MDAAEMLAAYRQIREITAQMLAAAQAGDWEALVNLEIGRKAWVERVSASSVSPGALAAEKDACIRFVLETDQQIMTLTRAWMGEMEEMLAAVRAQRKLERAYHGG